MNVFEQDEFVVGWQEGALPHPSPAASEAGLVGKGSILFFSLFSSFSRVVVVVVVGDVVVCRCRCSYRCHCYCQCCRRRRPCRFRPIFFVVVVAVVVIIVVIVVNPHYSTLENLLFFYVLGVVKLESRSMAAAALTSRSQGGTASPDELDDTGETRWDELID